MANFVFLGIRDSIFPVDLEWGINKPIQCLLMSVTFELMVLLTHLRSPRKFEKIQEKLQSHMNCTIISTEAEQNS